MRTIQVIICTLAFGYTAIYGGIFFAMFFNTLFGSFISGVGGMLLWFTFVAHAFHVFTTSWVYYDGKNQASL